MEYVEIRYNGKQYKSIKDTYVQITIDHLKKIIKPFETDIQKHGGRVIINVPKNLKDISVSVEGLPEDLTNKITDALH